MTATAEGNYKLTRSGREVVSHIYWLGNTLVENIKHTKFMKMHTVALCKSQNSVY